MEKRRVSGLSIISYAGLKRVEVFKTDVDNEEDAHYLLLLFCHRFPYLEVHFDLEDCDRILRVEGDAVSNEQVISLLLNYGYQCSALV